MATPTNAVDLSIYGSCSLDSTCQTCGEGAVPTVVLGIMGDTATVQDQQGNTAEVALDFVSGAQVGDVLLVQAGLALSLMQASGGEASA